ncbi:unnamed protein product [Candidula unifasciata]|uniref:Cytochrome b5 n=1 Tax=Candidula unifasciata TaxID=100452 RepID=A0A8S3YT58_9EUPU|nr:unnamed protein product [Candidula unifasciata]
MSTTSIKKGLSWALKALQILTVRKMLSRPIPRSEIADHCSSQSCWMVVNNKVYDVTRFLRMHPGGEDIILEYGGHDATSAFIDKGHSPDAYGMLTEYCIGRVVKADWFPEKNFT